MVQNLKYLMVEQVVVILVLDLLETKEQDSSDLPQELWV